MERFSEIAQCRFVGNIRLPGAWLCEKGGHSSVNGEVLHYITPKALRRASTSLEPLSAFAMVSPSKYLFVMSRLLWRRVWDIENRSSPLIFLRNAPVCLMLCRLNRDSGMPARRA